MREKAWLGTFMQEQHQKPNPEMWARERLHFDSAFFYIPFVYVILSLISLECTIRNGTQSTSNFPEDMYSFKKKAENDC